MCSKICETATNWGNCELTTFFSLSSSSLTRCLPTQNALDPSTPGPVCWHSGRWHLRLRLTTGQNPNRQIWRRRRRPSHAICGWKTEPNQTVPPERHTPENHVGLIPTLWSWNNNFKTGEWNQRDQQHDELVTALFFKRWSVKRLRPPPKGGGCLQGVCKSRLPQEKVRLCSVHPNIYQRIVQV